MACADEFLFSWVKAIENLSMIVEKQRIKKPFRSRTVSSHPSPLIQPN